MKEGKSAACKSKRYKCCHVKTISMERGYGLRLIISILFLKKCNKAISPSDHRGFLCLYFRQPNSTIFVFGEHPTKPNRCVLMSFNTNREETLIAETDFRAMCATACINGEYICFCPNPWWRLVCTIQYCLLERTETYVNTVIEVHWLYCSTRVENVQICFQIHKVVPPTMKKSSNQIANTYLLKMTCQPVLICVVQRCAYHNYKMSQHCAEGSGRVTGILM